jgi:NOL1/NOP2/sun family putative RNA methylase
VKQSPADILTAKQSALIARTAEALQITEPEAEQLLSTKRRQSIRINPLRTEIETALTAMRALGWRGEPYSWLPEGYSVIEGLEALRDSEIVARGDVLIQNAASWLPVLALNPGSDESILDMCAAPGAKTSHLAARTLNRASITANDNSRPRLAKLRALTNRLGANVDRYTLYDARLLAEKLKGEQFDKILLDAPCSGEGLMRLDIAKDFDMWSVAQIKRLQQLQKRLILQAWRLLKPGGTLVYSTCTMAPEENEAVIDYLLRRHRDAELVLLDDYVLPNRVPAVQVWNQKQFNPEMQKCLRLRPSSDIEAFFVASIRKSEHAPDADYEIDMEYRAPKG